MHLSCLFMQLWMDGWMRGWAVIWMMYIKGVLYGLLTKGLISHSMYSASVEQKLSTGWLNMGMDGCENSFKDWLKQK